MTKEPSNISPLTSDSGQTAVRIYVDDDTHPFMEIQPPTKLVLDTTRLTDGKHTLKIVAQSTNGREGLTLIPFEVRNGPAISVVGLQENDVVEDLVPITINAYSTEAGNKFIVRGSETPKAIPTWVWAGIIVFVGWALFFLIRFAGEGSYLSI